MTQSGGPEGWVEQAQADQNDKDKLIFDLREALTRSTDALRMSLAEAFLQRDVIRQLVYIIQESRPGVLSDWIGGEEQIKCALQVEKWIAKMEKENG